MDIEKLSSEEIRGMDKGVAVEATQEVRKALADIRLDIYSPAASNIGKKKNLKKSLARLMTVRSEQDKAAKGKKA